MKYAIVIEKTARNFAAFAPDLPGCVATGRTRGAVQRTMKGAIELHLNGLREDGAPIHRPTTVVDEIEAGAAGIREPKPGSPA